VELFRESKYPLTLELSVTNLFDRFYLFNFESVFSGTHVGRPREVTGRIVFHWRSQVPALAAAGGGP
jgi:outer membrane receptor for Fe3+-dicitrate